MPKIRINNVYHVIGGLNKIQHLILNNYIFEGMQKENEFDCPQLSADDMEDYLSPNVDWLYITANDDEELNIEDNQQYVSITAIEDTNSLEVFVSGNGSWSKAITNYITNNKNGTLVEGYNNTYNISEPRRAEELFAEVYAHLEIDWNDYDVIYTDSIWSDVIKEN